MEALRAHRVAVAAGEGGLDIEAYDYADAYAIQLPQPDSRTAEEFVRCALEQAASPIRRTIRIAHRYVLRVRLGPRSSRDHVFGWKIAVSTPEVVRLEAVSPLLGRAIIVGRRVDSTGMRLTTCIKFHRPTLGRAIWAVVGPLHRRIAPYLLEHTAAAGKRADDAGGVDA